MVVRRLRISFRCAARAGHFQQPNQNHRLAVTSPRPTDSRNSWNCSRHSTAPIDFPGAPQKIATTDRGCLPRFARSGAKRLSSRARAALGRSEITIQVQDHRKIWRTIFVTILGFSSYVSGSNRSAARRAVLVHLSRATFCRKQGKTLRARSSHTRSARLRQFASRELQSFRGKPGSTQCDIRAVDLFVTSKSNLFIREIADLLCAGFRATGCEAQLLIDQIPAEKTEEGRFKSWLHLTSSLICS
jgi:hypothetical protein